MFSATQTKAVEDLIRVGLRNPVRLTVKVASTSQQQQQQQQRSQSTKSNRQLAQQESNEAPIAYEQLAQQDDDALIATLDDQVTPLTYTLASTVCFLHAVNKPCLEQVEELLRGRRSRGEAVSADLHAHESRTTTEHHLFCNLFC